MCVVNVSRVYVVCVDVGVDVGGYSCCNVVRVGVAVVLMFILVSMLSV